MLQEYRLDTPLGPICGLRQAGSGILRVALHGWLDNAGSFVPLMQASPEANWLALDLPGHGFSFHLPDGLPYHFIDWISNVGWVLESLDEPVLMVGHSMGAGVAPMVAAAYPERVRGVAMLDGFGPLCSPESETGDLLRKGLYDSRHPRPIKQLTRDEGTARLAETRQIPLEAARFLAERSLTDTGYRHDPKLLWTSRQRLTETQVQYVLKEIDRPSLLIRPVEGILGQWPDLDQRIACYRGLQIEAVEGGHHVHLVDPGPTSAILEGWIGDGEKFRR